MIYCLHIWIFMWVWVCCCCCCIPTEKCKKISSADKYTTHIDLHRRFAVVKHPKPESDENLLSKTKIYFQKIVNGKQRRQSQLSAHNSNIVSMHRTACNQLYGFERIIELFARIAIRLSRIWQKQSSEQQWTAVVVCRARYWQWVCRAVCPVVYMSHFGIKLPTVLLRRTSNCISYYSLTCLALEPSIYNVKTINYHISTYFKFIVWSRRLCRIWIWLFLYFYSTNPTTIDDDTVRWKTNLPRTLTLFLVPKLKNADLANQNKNPKMCGLMMLYLNIYFFSTYIGVLWTVNARIHIYVLKSEENNNNKKKSTYSTSFSRNVWNVWCGCC